VFFKHHLNEPLENKYLPGSIDVVTLAGHVQRGQPVLSLGRDGSSPLEHHVYHILVSGPVAYVTKLLAVFTLAKLAKFFCETACDSDSREDSSVFALATLRNMAHTGSFLFVLHHPGILVFCENIGNGNNTY
jgi:hypothetical protein